MDKAFFGRGLLRIAWLSVRSVGAEEWNGLAAVNAVDVEQHGWNTGNAAGEMKGARDRAGRARALKSENITVLYVGLNLEKLRVQSGKECRRKSP